MAGMNHDHGMDGMNTSPPSSSMSNNTMQHSHEMMSMMHMTFFWGKNAEILFSGWPGTHSVMYALALVLVFVLSFLVEWLSHCKLIRAGGSKHVLAGLAQTVLHALRVGLAYLVMLAVMSFNGGVFLAALAGHTLGFFFFGSRVFTKSPPPPKTSNLPPTAC